MEQLSRSVSASQDVHVLHLSDPLQTPCQPCTQAHCAVSSRRGRVRGRKCTPNSTNQEPKLPLCWGTWDPPEAWALPTMPRVCWMGPLCGGTGVVRGHSRSRGANCSRGRRVIMGDSGPCNSSREREGGVLLLSTQHVGELAHWLGSALRRRVPSVSDGQTDSRLPHPPRSRTPPAPQVQRGTFSVSCSVLRKPCPAGTRVPTLRVVAPPYHRHHQQVSFYPPQDSPRKEINSRTFLLVTADPALARRPITCTLAEAGASVHTG